MRKAHGVKVYDVAERAFFAPMPERGSLALCNGHRVRAMPPEPSRTRGGTPHLHVPHADHPRFAAGSVHRLAPPRPPIGTVSGRDPAKRHGFTLLAPLWAEIAERAGAIRSSVLPCGGRLSFRI